jgi:GGDEF domain-containing protein
VAEAARPIPPAKATPKPVTRRGATKRQQALLAALTDRVDAATGRLQVAELVVGAAAELVHADTTALVVPSLQGPRVLWDHPRGARDPELWGTRTLAALLAAPEPIRLVMDGDPLAGGGRTALVTAPVSAAVGSIGVIVARRRSPKPFTVADEDALNRLGRICGARLHRTAERQAVAAGAVDRATGLGTHDLLVRDLSEAIGSLPRHGMPVTLLVCEVLGLSRLRADAGMAAADAAIVRVAARIGAELRVGDLLYRLSADELAVLLPVTGPDRAAAVADRLETAVDDLDGAGPGPTRLGLRIAPLPVEGTPERVMLRAVRELAAARDADARRASEVV